MTDDRIIHPDPQPDRPFRGVNQHDPERGPRARGTIDVLLPSTELLHLLSALGPTDPVPELRVTLTNVRLTDAPGMRFGHGGPPTLTLDFVAYGAPVIESILAPVLDQIGGDQ